MCGIVAVIGSREAAPLLLDGLRKLEYRGYDSAGICTFEDNSTDYFDIIFWTTSPINLYNNIFKNKLIKNTGIHNVPMVVYYFVVKIKNLNDFTFIQDFRKKTLIL